MGPRRDAKHTTRTFGTTGLFTVHCVRDNITSADRRDLVIAFTIVWMYDQPRVVGLSLK
jgi:hypothetical protein